MKVFKWVAIAFSVYSKVPMPRLRWDEDDMAYSLAFFPLIGVLIGGLVFVINTGYLSFTLPVAVRIIVTLIIPILITGGIHLDGLMDTEDALNSYADKDTNLEILKDPHIGAFAVISLMKWMLIFAAAVTAVLLNPGTDDGTIAIFGLIFVVSRGLSGIAAMVFNKAKPDGMLYEETKNRKKAPMVLLLIQLVIGAAAMIYMEPLYGAAVLSGAALSTLYYRSKAYKEFGGVTGDTAGYFLTVSEVVMTLVLSVCLYALPEVMP